MTEDWRTDLDRFVIYLEAKDVSQGYLSSSKSYLRHLGERFGKPFLNLTREELQKWFAEIAKSGVTGKKAVGPASMPTVVGRVKTCLRWLNQDRTPDNIRGINYKKTKKLQSRVRGTDELLTDEEIDTIGGALKQPWKAVFLTLAHTGARPTEVLSLNVRDIDGPKTENGRTFYTIHFRNTKTGIPREPSVYDPRAIAALEEWLRLGPTSGYLFPSIDRTSHTTYGPYGKRLRETVKSLGLTKRVYPYLTRHTFVSKLKRQEVPDSLIMEWVGFDDPRMLQNYGKLSSDERRELMASYIGPEPVKEVLPEAEIEKIVQERVNQAVREMRGQMTQMIQNMLANPVSVADIEAELEAHGAFCETCKQEVMEAPDGGWSHIGHADHEVLFKQVD